MDRNTPVRRDRRRLLAVGVVAVALMISGLAAVPAVAAKTAFPQSYRPETASGYTNTFSTNDVLSPACPEAIAATPGSDPASKVLNGLNTPASFGPGGTVHFTYLDNPHTNGGTQNFTIQDCVVTYPAGFFTAADFDPATGVLINAKYDKSLLTKGGTQIDGASLSGINQSVGNIYYTWTAPADLAVTTWVCFFARDIRNDHGGAGNRKVPPTCYQMTGPPSTTTTTGATTTTTVATTTTTAATTTTTQPMRVITPDIFVGYADELHAANVQFTPSPWRGSPGVQFLGCTAPSTECGQSYDAGAVRVDNPAGNPTLTLTAASVDVGPCHFIPWGAFLPSTAGPGGTFVLTQTGTLGPPQAPPCDGRVGLSDRAITNFDTSEGPLDRLDIGFSNCDPNAVAAPVIKLTFSNGMTLTATDTTKVLTSGGVDRFACSGLDEAAPWTAIAAGGVVRVG